MKTSEYTGSESGSDYAAKSDGALGRATMSVHSAVDQTASAADGVARKVIPAIDRAAEFAHHAVDKAAAGAAPAAEWISDQASAINATQKKLVSGTRQNVAANPLMSVGIALAAGYLISRVIRK